MPYPVLPVTVAREAYARRRRGGEAHALVESETAERDGGEFRPELAQEVLEECFGLSPGPAGPRRAHFDAICARHLHTRLDLPAVCAGDPDFWRWLTFAYGGCGADLVDLRYGRNADDSIVDSEAPHSPVGRPVYYGLGPMRKGMFAKLWICANLMYRPHGEADPYDGLDYHDVDLWDSHVIDIDWGGVPAMARSFVQVVRDMALPRGDKPGECGFRHLAREIRRRYPTTAFEVFTDHDAYTWVAALWRDRETWCRLQR